MSYKKIDEYTVKELLPSFLERRYDECINGNVSIENESIMSETKYVWCNSYYKNDGTLKKVYLKQSIKDLFKNIETPYSFAELEYFLAFEYVFNDVIMQKEFATSNKKHKTDIYLTNLNFAIEYDGKYWHKNTKIQDEENDKILEDNNVDFVRIREYGLTTYGKKNYISETDFIETIKECITYINKCIENKIDIKKINFDELQEYVDNNSVYYTGIVDNQFSNEPIKNYIKLNPDILEDQNKYQDLICLIRLYSDDSKESFFKGINNDDLVLKFYKDEQLRNSDGAMINWSMDFFDLNNNKNLQEMLDYIISYDISNFDNKSFVERFTESSLEKFLLSLEQGSICDEERIDIIMDYINSFKRISPNYYRMWRIDEIKEKIARFKSQQ